MIFLTALLLGALALVVAYLLQQPLILVSVKYNFASLIGPLHTLGFSCSEPFGAAQLYPLHYAVLKNHSESVAALLRSCDALDVNMLDKNERTATQVALEHELVRVMRVLAQDPRVDIYRGRSVLAWAAERDVALLRVVLARADADVNTRDETGWTPLHFAAWLGAQECVDELLARGAKVDQYDDGQGWQPVHAAAWAGKVPILFALLEAGADVSAKSESGETVLHLAAAAMEDEMLKWLLRETDVDPSVQENEAKHTFLHVLAGRDAPHLMHEALDAGLSVDQADMHGRSPLIVAAEAERIENVHKLIELGAAVNLQDLMGLTALHWATLNDDVDMAQALLDAGADATLKDEDGKSPRSIVQNCEQECNEEMQQLFQQ